MKWAHLRARWQSQVILITRRETVIHVTNRTVNQTRAMPRRFYHTKRQSGLFAKAVIQVQVAVARMDTMAYLMLEQYPEQGTHCNVFYLE